SVSRKWIAVVENPGSFFGAAFHLSRRHRYPTQTAVALVRMAVVSDNVGPGDRNSAGRGASLCRSLYLSPANRIVSCGDVGGGGVVRSLESTQPAVCLHVQRWCSRAGALRSQPDDVLAKQHFSVDSRACLHF